MNNTYTTFCTHKKISFFSLFTVLTLTVCLSSVTACGDEVLYEVNADSGEVSSSEERDNVSEEAFSADESLDTTYTAEVQLSVEEEEQYIIVHLCGAVVNPGVYELKQGARVVDGVISAGGFAEEASEEGLNLASPLTDGSRIYIPTATEVEEARTEGSLSSGETFDGATTLYDRSGTQSASGSSPKSNLVNINTATEDELTTLTGIGPTRAKAIIEYRETSGAFKTIEDIKNVSGIGEASFRKLKASITVK